jgi:molecular chaperone DnaJ
MAKSYYDVLGVSKDASEDDIKSAYRKLARQYHPDLHPNDAAAAEKFKEISEAYDTLSDPQKKAAYDNPNPFGGEGGFGGFGGFDGGDIFGDIFNMFSGGNRGSRVRQRGADIQQNLTLTFEEAAFGVSKEIRITRSEPCASCKGTGAKDGTEFTTCSTCNGQGRVRVAQNTPFGRVSTERPCSACRGTGKIIKTTCPDCGGRGVNRRSVTLKVNIPAGVEDENVLTVRGEGEKVASGDNGNLLIVLRVLPHKIFKRRGADLYLDYPITFAQAILGDKISIPSLKGDAFSYTIPEGTLSGSTVRLRGQGITTKRGTGDMYLTLIVDMPKKLSRSQRDAIKKLADDLKVDQYDKIKDFNRKNQ